MQEESDAVALRCIHRGTSAECGSLNKAMLFQERLLDDIDNIQA
jgi:hypothetical protein